MILVEHGDRRMLINASAGFVPGALNGRKADVVFMGTGQLGKRPISYMEDYWREVVERPAERGASSRSTGTISPAPWTSRWSPCRTCSDDFAASMEFLNERGRTSGIDIKLPEAFVAFDPFENLPANN